MKMSEILGYGEDALTLWALRRFTSFILDPSDKTLPSDCLILYRPSFGRRSKENSSVFGEFDAILASRQNIYLIESKWDNLTEFKDEKLIIRREQLLRHRIFSWYLTHWNEKYSGKWASFRKEQQHNFNFEGKQMAPVKSLLAINLESVLNRLLEHCKEFSSESNIKNVLLFFYRGIPKPSFEVERTFRLIPIDYGKGMLGNFIVLYP